MNGYAADSWTDRVPVEELRARWQHLQKAMAAVGLEAAVVMQNADLYYFSGTLQSGVLYIPVEGDPLYAVRRDVCRARRESYVPSIVPFRSFRELPGIVADHGLPRVERVGMELDVLPVATFQRVSHALGDPHVEDLTPLVRSLRSVKSAWELERMRQAGRQLDESWRLATQMACEGLSDLDLAVALEGLARRRGHPGYARMRAFNGEVAMGLVLAGADGAASSFRNTPLGGAGLHPSVGFGPSGRRLRPGQPVTVDLIGFYNGYLADQTRTLALGYLDEPLCRAYEAMCQIQDLLKKSALPGVAWGQLYDDCCRLASELGYARHFMGQEGSQVSFIGHGIGLEIDEYPFIARGFRDQVLRENMTFAFEPKAVFPGQGAVGIENTFVVTAAGVEPLTLSDETLCIL
ncbi:prolidase family protein [Syntrophotalea carbinolica DSM 2380]|uniref:Prolidase family protein n=1 Tax=Syntrophotalea carbinolica (strain DSM 2380 / NBRC 103641 / GraBd1) TaxID=338963 RepID=Q3A354_SYNC1|nr:Xaa-Pro peptidase family protein [Syntrophotalea carbinolica]ABA89203.1 prolidase family protein [Syntrophotalea carbinolica DSM 2380]